MFPSVNLQLRKEYKPKHQKRKNETGRMGQRQRDKSGCKQFLKGIQFEDSEKLQLSEKADIRPILKEREIKDRQKVPRRDKSGCKQMLKGMQFEDREKLQLSEKVDFRPMLKGS
ncbi:hypothetical protein AVEN_209116-1 [Araneus ventricosus]|uniref:Uncharacterized protein n=1 Tax=Araneus ventricosus TaxID=182803 RepID=A0A4Y2F9J8_ARAVE|nr:hypothetical protein AVEN_274879-1 [Araneus ventricosus]GBM38173.1 hypothetical protein AVEN_209116-1 [Araneus ventricosus]